MTNADEEVETPEQVKARFEEDGWLWAPQHAADVEVLIAEIQRLRTHVSDLVEPDYEPCQIEHDCEAEPEECWHTPKWWTCRYYQTVGRADVPTEQCSFGCVDEPNCVTGQPTGGWEDGDDG